MYRYTMYITALCNTTYNTRNKETKPSPIYIPKHRKSIGDSHSAMSAECESPNR